MSDKVEDILYQAWSEGLWKEVMEVSKSLDNNGKFYQSVGDKFEEAYYIVKTKDASIFYKIIKKVVV